MNALRLTITKLTLTSLLLLSASASSCEMIMGYRTSARLPLIESPPSNDGLYTAIFRQALKNIDCNLSIIRAPKKRILKMLADGQVDFYPGLGSSTERKKYLYFFENGLTSHTVAFSHKDTADIHHLSEMKGKILLAAIGSNLFDAEKYNIHIRYAYDLTIDSAIKLIENKRVDFYIYNKDSLKYYLNSQPNKKIKIHPCCFEPKPMHLGFSKKSKYAKSPSESALNNDKLSATIDLNQRLDKNSKAVEFKTELMKMKQRGEISRMKQQYYQ